MNSIISKMAVFHVQEEYFNAIKNGSKTIEGRKNSITWSSIQIGDVVEVCCNSSFFVRVIDIKLYPTLEAFLDNEDIQAIMPGKSYTEVVNSYLEFWTREEIEEKGMRIFHIVKL